MKTNIRDNKVYVLLNDTIYLPEIADYLSSKELSSTVFQILEQAKTNFIGGNCCGDTYNEYKFNLSADYDGYPCFQMFGVRDISEREINKELKEKERVSREEKELYLKLKEKYE